MQRIWVFQGNDHENNDSEALRQRIRELETELAKSKLSQVESECKSQSLQHELNSLKQTPPSQTTSWKTKWDNITSNIPNTIPSFQSHISDIASQLNSFDESAVQNK